MTSYDEVQQMVVDSEFTDWIRFQNLGVWTFQDDVALRIAQQEQLGQSQQPWTTQFQAQSVRYGYVIYYNNSPVEYHVIVGVDNNRAFVPEPRQPQSPEGSFTITPYQRSLGDIVTGDPGTLDSYLSRAGIVVEEQ